jgi:hypothetical protein
MIALARPLSKHAQLTVKLDMMEAQISSLVTRKVVSVAKSPHANPRSAPLEWRQELESPMTAQAAPLAKHAQHLV